jgi:hypothetical protein
LRLVVFVLFSTFAYNLYLPNFIHELKTHTMRTLILHLIVSVILLSSCSSHKYVNTAEQQSNTTFQLNTNVKGITVEVLSGKNGTGRIIGVSDQYNSTFNLGKLRFYGNYIRVSGKDYDPVVQKVKITPRGKAIKKDLILGLFTYFTPFLIDPFRSDFYKIREDYKSINVNLKYNQVYMYRAFKEIANSSDVEKFKRYIDTYPQSNYLYRAKDKIDSLDLNTAMLIGTEESLGDFIESHGDAKVNYLSAAQKQKEMLEGARIEYDNIATKTDLNEFKNYLRRYPKFKESSLAVTRSYEIAKSSGLLDKLLEFNRDILVPNQNILNIQEKQRITSGLNNAVDLAIIREKTDQKDLPNSYINILLTAQEISSNYSNINMLPISKDTYRIKLADIFLSELLNSKTEKQQKEILERYSSKINKLKYISSSVNFIVSCLQYTRSFNGEFKLFNQDILHNYIEHSSERDALRELSDVMSGNVEEIGLINGQIVKFRIFQSANPIAAFERKPDGTLYFARFQNGVLLKEKFNNYSMGIDYFYDFENGKNKSLAALDEKISMAEAAMKNRNYSEALIILTTSSKNPYPRTLGQNVKIQGLIIECNKQKQLQLESEEKRKSEELRLARLKLEQEEMARIIAQETQTSLELRNAINIECQDFGDYPQKYLNKTVRMYTFYSNDDNTDRYKEKEYSAGYNKYIDVTKYVHKGLRIWGPSSYVPDDIYFYNEKNYYSRTFNCPSAPTIRAIIPVDIQVPDIKESGSVYLVGKLEQVELKSTTHSSYETLRLVVISIIRP